MVGGGVCRGEAAPPTGVPPPGRRRGPRGPGEPRGTLGAWTPDMAPRQTPLLALIVTTHTHISHILVPTAAVSFSPPGPSSSLTAVYQIPLWNNACTERALSQHRMPVSLRSQLKTARSPHHRFRETRYNHTRAPSPMPTAPILRYKNARYNIQQVTPPWMTAPIADTHTHTGGDTTGPAWLRRRMNQLSSLSAVHGKTNVSLFLRLTDLWPFACERQL